MASDPQNGVASDTEASEKPVREQLKKASISKTALADATTASEGQEQEEQSQEGHSDEVENGGGNRGRPQKKRSFDEAADDEAEEKATSSTRQHTRKRSRDSTAEEEELNNGSRKSSDRPRDSSQIGEKDPANGHLRAPSTARQRTPDHAGEKRADAPTEQMASPKTKRSRLQVESDEALTNTTAKSTKDDDAEKSEPPAEKSNAKIPAGSGFANTSTSSPFASLAGSKSPASDSQTSTSAFAASGFSALTGSTSGFGAIGKSSGGFGAGGSFATTSKSTTLTEGSKQDADKTKSPSSSAFGGALGQQSAFSSAGTGTGTGLSTFASGASGFGKLGGSGGFGSTFGGGSGFGGLGSGGLTTFASGKPSASLLSSSKATKPLGAPADDAEDAEDAGEDPGPDDSGFKSPISQTSDKQDERFYAQDLETGEEEETTAYSCRAKLYNFADIGDGKKEWKERGLGVVRLNVSHGSAGKEETRLKARLLMRAEGSHRVILNTPVKKEIKVGAPDGGKPQGGNVFFMGAVDGKEGLELLQLKIRQQFATELYDKIAELQAVM
ncbi:hypothetical protein BDY17DRAFT_351697 [Neohortaea acidophila]|uniref:RanBD1 domain-containing protein n=1 Tax=Neohortaea acidophila TaxID=245834 RepID=A0A6A6PYK5_9PEZI|nr:uncharacterized protein BDY17DRAFT_351697 [Neohortaea acidophila]KAF2484824.1 hypothetical protein BDY17DRAFT_351697 [Neohortaea acidophila]